MHFSINFWTLIHSKSFCIHSNHGNSLECLSEFLALPYMYIENLKHNVAKPRKLWQSWVFLSKLLKGGICKSASRFGLTYIITLIFQSTVRFVKGPLICPGCQRSKTLLWPPSFFHTQHFLAKLWSKNHGIPQFVENKLKTSAYGSGVRLSSGGWYRSWLLDIICWMTERLIANPMIKLILSMGQSLWMRQLSP